MDGEDFYLGWTERTSIVSGVDGENFYLGWTERTSVVSGVDGEDFYTSGVKGEDFYCICGGQRGLLFGMEADLIAPADPTRQHRPILWHQLRYAQDNYWL